ncbi:MAG TPA: glucosamine-6-phosphate isomerase [Pirellulaceae bacterium]
MNWQPPDYLSVKPEELGRGTPVKVWIGGDQEEIALDFARAILAVIGDAQAAGKAATLILPVGPVDQFPILASMINEQRLDCRDLVIINMDEYLDDNDHWVPIDHPLSFRGFMNRKFYDQVDPQLAPPMENRVFPDPANCQAIGKLIDSRGGVDVCFGGIGINCHLAFNEPPEPGERVSVEQFAARPTRVLDLTRETRTINSVTVGGDIGVIPTRAVTVGMQEILAARKLRFYCNRPWQRGVVRRVLHGPITAACPASLLRTHPDAELTVANYVAEPPDIQLR